MAVTPNYGWPVPVATDYVKDGWEAISDLGNAIDTTVAGLGSGLTLITSQTVTGATTLNINNCFTSTYKNYRILISGWGSTNGQILQARLRASGTDVTTSYNGGVDGTDPTNAGSATRWKLASTNSMHLGYISSNSSALNSYSIDLFNPNTTDYKPWHMLFISVNSGTFNYSGYGGGYLNTNTAQDGITIFSPNNITVTVKIYGYEN